MGNGRSAGGLCWWAVPLALAVGLGCAEPEAPAPEATAVGAPAPAAVTASATIGALGGTLASADGRVTISIPAQALAADALISIVPITNFAHGRIGPAYRMTGAETFLKPVSLIFSWNEEDVVGTAPEFLDVAFQNREGFWELTEAVTVDAAARTITATTRHFTDFSFLSRFRLTPASANLKVNQARRFQIEMSFPIFGMRPSPGGDRPVLGFDWQPISVTYGARLVSDWSVNGIVGGNSTIGTIYPDIDRGGYAAPERKPSPETVTVSVRLTNFIRPKETGLFKSTVRIVDEGPLQRIDVSARYAMQGQLLTAFVKGNVTDNGFQFQMGFPVVDEEPPVMDAAGGQAGALTDTRPGCLTPTVGGPWDELTATSVAITGSFLTVLGTASIPSITLGVGEGNCATTTRTEPATTRSAGVQIALPSELFTSVTAPATPVTVTQDGWTFTYTTVR